jgi:hypothetical protein
MLLHLAGGGNDNGVEVVRDLGADKVIYTITTSVAVLKFESQLEVSK